LERKTKMPKINLDYNQAHEFVEKNKSNGFFWDGYTIMRWTPSNNAFMEKNGMFKNNRWGFINRYFLKSDGTWDLSDKYAKFI
jgi:hypothetical protein